MQYWNSLTAIDQLLEVENQSSERPLVLFKHSTRCSISNMALSRLKQDESKLAAVADLYYLDIIRFREVSDEIASRYGIVHESPQVLVLVNGKVVYHASHLMIISNELINRIAPGV